MCEPSLQPSQRTDLSESLCVKKCRKQASQLRQLAQPLSQAGEAPCLPSIGVFTAAHGVMPMRASYSLPCQADSLSQVLWIPATACWHSWPHRQAVSSYQGTQFCLLASDMCHPEWTTVPDGPSGCDLDSQNQLGHLPPGTPWGLLSFLGTAPLSP